jgi:hypothetical protein
MENNNKKEFGSWINPAEEDLWARMIELNDRLRELEKGPLMSDVQKEILQKCIEKLEEAKAAIKSTWGGRGLLPILKKNYRIFWSLVHRVDEDILLLVPQDGLLGNAIDIKAFFDMNIKEEKIRAEWLGSAEKKGKLQESIEKLEVGKDFDQVRCILRGALRIANDQMDQTFWALSLNALVSLLSCTLLGLLMVIFWFFCYKNTSECLAMGSIRDGLITIALLGLMGAYVSNVMTKEDFLFIRGPFWRYLLHHIFSKPILSAFAAVFIFLLEKSKLIFSIGPVGDLTAGAAAGAGAGAAPAATALQIITLNVQKGTEGYVYAILALVSGFAAEKILRGMIDKVLKRLEDKAEKTKETKEEAK